MIRVSVHNSFNASLKIAGIFQRMRAVQTRLRRELRSMVQTIVIVRQVMVRGKKTEERKRCFPNPLPDEATKREVAELLRAGNFRFLDGNARDIAKTRDVARLIEEVRPYLNGASAEALATTGV